MRDAGYSESEESFDLIHHVNRLHFIDLLAILDGIELPMARTLRAMASNINCARCRNKLQGPRDLTICKASPTPLAANVASCQEADWPTVLFFKGFACEPNGFKVAVLCMALSIRRHRHDLSL